MTKNDVKFIAEVWRYFNANARDMPWRRAEQNGSFDPYKIMVSELMLQQTQVARVIPKFEAFIARFPDWQTLAEAPLSEVLLVWSGLGYNRRAKYLHEAAKQLAYRDFPQSVNDLQKFKGIGANTAAAILTYSYNMSVPFVETNIRTVYIHHYFRKEKVSDAEILRIVQRTINSSRPREWMWALMDYGVYLKANGKNGNTRSAHYKKQAKFEGSLRQLRGEIMRRAHQEPFMIDLVESLGDDRAKNAIDALVADELLTVENGVIRIAHA